LHLNSGVVRSRLRRRPFLMVYVAPQLGHGGLWVVGVGVDGMLE
jgi:hypothetical protein